MSTAIVIFSCLVSLALSLSLSLVQCAQRSSLFDIFYCCCYLCVISWFFLLSFYACVWVCHWMCQLLTCFSPNTWIQPKCWISSTVLSVFLFSNKINSILPSTSNTLDALVLKITQFILFVLLFFSVLCDSSPFTWIIVNLVAQFNRQILICAYDTLFFVVSSTLAFPLSIFFHFTFACDWRKQNVLNVGYKMHTEKSATNNIRDKSFPSLRQQCQQQQQKRI